MQLKAQPENSLSSKLEYLKQLVNAKTTKEFYGVRIIPKEEWSKDPDKVADAYEQNAD